MNGVSKAVANDIKGIKQALKEKPTVIDSAFWKRICEFADFKYLNDEQVWHEQESAVMAGYCRYAHHVILKHCMQQDLLNIKKLIPIWSNSEKRWGWTANYYL